MKRILAGFGIGLILLAIVGGLELRRAPAPLRVATHGSFAWGDFPALEQAAALAQVPDPSTNITLSAWQFQPTDNATGYALTGAPAGNIRQLMVTPKVGNGTGSIQIRTAAGTAGFDLVAGSIIIIPAYGASTLFFKVGTNGDAVGFLAWMDK